MDLGLTGKIALVAGASKGLGFKDYCSRNVPPQRDHGIFSSVLFP